LVGCFCIGKEPTGSADPYGLRRAVNGIVAVIQAKHFSLDLDELVEYSYKLYGPLLPKDDNGRVKSFIAVRIKNIMLEAGLRHDIIDAVLSNFNDIDDVFLRAGAIDKSIDKAWFEGLRQSADRVARISKAATRGEVREADLEDIEEKHLSEVYLTINWETEELINKDDYIGAIKKLTSLTKPIENFFEKVLVMHQDERLKSNRLALLKSISNLYLKIANFSKIV
ncbi:glycine--tRNA ligase subunit beta, partial [Candidatus Margulisiibacteriota bacterium]